MTAAISATAAIAIGATAAVGAGATIYAANKSASATKDATNAAIAGQQGALAQEAAMSQPYRDLGTNNIDQYQQLLSGSPERVQQTLESTPGYQFTKSTGIESAQRAAASSGLNLSGNQVAGVESFGANLADSTYSERLNQLLQPIQLGQAAAAGQSANIQGAANNTGNLIVGQGNTDASIYANTAASLSKIASGAGNQAITSNTLKGLGSPQVYDPAPATNSTPYNVQTYG